jgi:hypothetical protein
MNIIGTLGQPLGSEGGFVIQKAPSTFILEWAMPPDVSREKEIEGSSGRRRWFIFTVFLDGSFPDESLGDLAETARAANMSYMQLANLFISADPMDRARAWAVYGEVWGWDNIDDSFDEITLADAEKRYGLPPSKYSQTQSVPKVKEWDELDDFTRSYMTTALWSSNDESTPSGGYPMDDNYDTDDISNETWNEMVKDCEDFQQAQAADLQLAYNHPKVKYDESSAGHDFWLTRNGHGAGFWDRGLGTVGDRLSKASKPYGEVNLYIGDDDKIHG